MNIVPDTRHRGVAQIARSTRLSAVGTAVQDLLRRRCVKA